MEMQNRKLIYIVSGMVFVIDFISKMLLKNKHFNIIKNFFIINYSRNYGAAFSILQNQRWILLVISITFFVLIIKYVKKFSNNLRNNVAFGLLIGGLFGNLYDRLIYGYVRDFISLKFGGYYYPVFNVADITIVIGIILIIIAIIKKEDSNAKD